jgi:flagellar protein FlaG
MADQVNPMGGLISGLPVAIATVPAQRPAPEKAPAVSVSDSEKQIAPPTGGSTMSLDEAAKFINSHLQQTSTELKIQVDKGTGRVVYSILNQATGEVILQVPSEEVLAMARNLHALNAKAGASGVLVDKNG